MAQKSFFSQSYKRSKYRHEVVLLSLFLRNSVIILVFTVFASTALSGFWPFTFKKMKMFLFLQETGRPKSVAFVHNALYVWLNCPTKKKEAKISSLARLCWNLKFTCLQIKTTFLPRNCMQRRQRCFVWSQKYNLKLYNSDYIAKRLRSTFYAVHRYLSF